MAAGKDGDKEQIKTRTAKDGKVIPDIAFPVECLQAATLDIDYRINRLNLHVLSINSWQGKIALKDSVLNWPESKLDLLGGDIIFDLHIDAQQPKPA